MSDSLQRARARLSARLSGCAYLLMLAAVTGCATLERRSLEVEQQRRADHLADLTTFLTGSFSSRAQALADPENFADIRLRAVPIWPERGDGVWLYVEQAAAEALERPYRQRVYRLAVAEGDTFTSEVFTLPGEARRFAGAWREADPLRSLTPDDLTARVGCTITLRRRADGAFSGGTSGVDCASDLRGASYATSEATLHPDRLETWDRGFDDTGKQVWGATKSGYVFERVADERRDGT